tara:strand:+ start:2102 stop:3358 length:1257 start_codon:yes stop_codon:yes gene_type:complete
MLKNILITGSFLSLLNFYGIGTIFITTYLISNFSSIATLGKFSYVISIFSITTIPISSVIVQYIIKEVNLSKEKIEQILSEVLLYVLLLIPISIILFYLLTCTSNYNHNIIIKFSILILLSFVKTISTGYLIASEKVLLGKFSELFIYPTAFVIYLIINRNSLDFDVVINGYFLSSIINITVYMIIFITQYKWKLKLCFKIKAMKFKKTLKFSILGVLDTLYENILILFSGFFGLYELTGFYKIILDIFKFPKKISFSINQVFSPKVAKLFSLNKIKKLQYLIRKLNVIMFIFMIIFSFLIIVFADLLMVVFNVHDKDFLILLYLFCLAEIIFFTSYSGGTIILMTGQIKYFISIKIICITTFLLSLLFSYNYGLIGAGLSFVLVRTVKMILITFYTYRETKLKINLIQNFNYVFQKK